MYIKKIYYSSQKDIHFVKNLLFQNDTFFKAKVVLYQQEFNFLIRN